MEHYLKKLQHSGGHEGMTRSVKKFKKIAIVGIIVLGLIFISLIILAIFAASWLFNRGEEQVRNARQTAVQQVQSAATPLNLESYVTNNQVDTAKLTQTFTALPDQVQSAWLDQFQTQLDELRAQAGVSDQTIQTLTTLYNTLQQTAQLN